MKPIERLRYLLETHGIYRQAVKLLREHIRETSDDKPAPKQDKPDKPYNPRQEYYNRQNSTQKARAAARAKHQFSKDIGGSADNYRK